MRKGKFLQWMALFTFLTASKQMNAQMNTNPEQVLTIQQRNIVLISASAATGDLEKLKAGLNAGLDSGLTINETKEVLVQLYAYCGFPRSLNAITTLMAVLKERKTEGKQDVEGKDATPVSDNQKYQTGKHTLQQLTGKEEKELSGANAFAPALDIFLKEHLFADIFSRDILNYQQRELVTVAALAAMTGVEPQLQAHISMALNTGITDSGLMEAFNIIEQTVSKKQGDIAREDLKKIVSSK